MLTIDKFVTASPEQWEIIIEGMRNPMNSWNRMDSHKTHVENPETLNTADFEFFLGDADFDLMRRLNAGGPVHAKYRRMIPVWVTLTAPLYWWKEFDTYKVGTVTNSCSTMHKIQAKPFVSQDFSCEHLIPQNWNSGESFDLPSDVNTDIFINTEEGYLTPFGVLMTTIDGLNLYRKAFLETGDKLYWWQMIQLLPTSYNQKRTVSLNYEVLRNIYISRKDHKLDEWHVFCDWIKKLPYSELITGEEVSSVG